MLNDLLSPQLAPTYSGEGARRGGVYVPLAKWYVQRSRAHRCFGIGDRRLPSSACKGRLLNRVARAAGIGIGEGEESFPLNIERCIDGRLWQFLARCRVCWGCTVVSMAPAVTHGTARVYDSHEPFASHSSFPEALGLLDWLPLDPFIFPLAAKFCDAVLADIFAKPTTTPDAAHADVGLAATTGLLTC